MLNILSHQILGASPKNPPLGSRREGDFFVHSIRLFHHKPDLVSVFRQPFAFVQTPPRRDDEPTVGLCFPVWVGATCFTVQRAQH